MGTVSPHAWRCPPPNLNLSQPRPSQQDTFLPHRPKVAIKVIDTQWERIGKHEAAVLRRLAHADPDRCGAG